MMVRARASAQESGWAWGPEWVSAQVRELARASAFRRRHHMQSAQARQALPRLPAPRLATSRARWVRDRARLLFLQVPCVSLLPGTGSSTMCQSAGAARASNPDHGADWRSARIPFQLRRCVCGADEGGNPFGMNSPLIVYEFALHPTAWQPGAFMAVTAATALRGIGVQSAATGTRTTAECPAAVPRPGRAAAPPASPAPRPSCPGRTRPSRHTWRR